MKLKRQLLIFFVVATLVAVMTWGFFEFKILKGTETALFLTMLLVGAFYGSSALALGLTVLATFDGLLAIFKQLLSGRKESIGISKEIDNGSLANAWRRVLRMFFCAAIWLLVAVGSYWGLVELGKFNRHEPLF